MLVGIMGSSHEVELPNFPSFESPHSWTAPDAKARPDFGLLFTVDAQSVVRRCGALVVPVGASLVGAHAGVDHHPAAVQRQFVTEDIAMAVAGLVVRPQLAAVENQAALGTRVTHYAITGFAKHRHFGAVI